MSQGLLAYMGDLQRSRPDIDNPYAPVLAQAIGLLLEGEVLHNLHLDALACLQKLTRNDNRRQYSAPDGDAEGDVVLGDELV